MARILSDTLFLDHAIPHYNEAIRYFEMEGNQYDAGTTRHTFAVALAISGRLSDALLYARAALGNFESYGGRAKENEEKTKGLIGEIEKAISGQPSAFS